MTHRPNAKGYPGLVVSAVVAMRFAEWASAMVDRNGDACAKGSGHACLQQQTYKRDLPTRSEP